MLMAQNRTVTGSVISAEDGEPVIGATVIVPGTNIGTVTGLDGKFSLNVPENAKQLTISYVGMASQTVNIRNNKVSVYLEADDKILDDVVVTAMGLKKSEKSLGYSAQTLKDEELTVGKVTDVTSAMAGKIAGVQISSTSGDPGQANSVIIRGVSSINGSNQPLYVVDGVPLQTATMQAYSQQTAIGGISNINPNDIESMTVLKGAAATALYGSRAANGVIVITTKEGAANKRRNFSISYDGSVQFRTVANLPKFQNKFGQGWNGKQTFIENGSWGPEMDGSTQVYGPIWNHQQLIHEYSAVESNIEDFFETGLSTSHSVALSGISDDKRMTYYLSYSFTKDDGVIPDDKDSYKRHTIAYRGSYKPTDWFKLS